MRICIFSDIHGNLYALEEFIEKSSQLDVALNIFCGDIFGYYYDQESVITMLRNMKNLFCVKGNHDLNYLNICSGLGVENKFVRKYGNSYKNISEKISQENRLFMENMPNFLELNCEGKKIGVVHGSLFDHSNGRVYPNTEILKPSLYQKYDYVILGHTHYRMVKQVGSTVVINPGSIGQTRDNNGFCYAVLSVNNGEIAFNEIQWDRRRLVSDIEKYDNGNKDLIEILFRDEVF